MRQLGSVLVGLLGVVGAVNPPAAAAPSDPLQRARYLMGTLCTATAYPGATRDVPAALDEALAAIASVEARISTWQEDSELSRANRAAGRGSFQVTPELAELLRRSLHLAGTTEGAFDPAIGSLLTAWDLRGHGRVPSPEELRRAREDAGFEKVHLEATTGRLRYGRPGLWIDAGGIGKGFALDRAVEVLRSAGMGAALLDFGGQLLAHGAPPGEDAWTVAVAHPEDRNRPAVMLGLRDLSVATSSPSVRSLLVEGRRVGHILDPRTGVPVGRVGSVSVVARSATEADALATALFVMGPEQGLQWADAAGYAAGFLEPVPDSQRLRLRANRRFSALVIARREFVEPVEVVLVGARPARRSEQ